MKKKLFYIAMIVFSLSIIAGSTFALFTTESRARNVITTGHLEVFVVEEQTGGTAYPSSAIPIMPGVTVSKIAMVEASETCAPAWVRVNLETVITDADGNAMPHTQQQLDQIITIEKDEENWIEQDGWYYYNQFIEKGGRTTPLFQEVQFSGPNMGNEYQGATIEIIVTTQGVQKDNNGDSVLEAAGWPRVPESPEEPENPEEPNEKPEEPENPEKEPEKLPEPEPDVPATPNEPNQKPEDLPETDPEEEPLPDTPVKPEQ